MFYAQDLRIIGTDPALVVVSEAIWATDWFQYPWARYHDMTIYYSSLEPAAINL